MGYVYVICDSYANTYKIGVTKNKVDKRMKELKTGNSSDLFVLTYFESEHYKEVEKLFHRKYSYLRVSGEWFELPDEIILNIEKVFSDIEENHIFLKNNNTFYK